MSGRSQSSKLVNESKLVGPNMVGSRIGNGMTTESVLAKKYVRFANMLLRCLVTREMEKILFEILKILKDYV